jgi:hypothetical protein
MTGHCIFCTCGVHRQESVLKMRKLGKRNQSPSEIAAGKRLNGNGVWFKVASDF